MHRLSFRTLFAFATLLSLGFASSSGIAAGAPRIEQRCGWFENPTPGNVTLTDRDGTWVIAVQGEYEARGDWPVFDDAQWVVTNSGQHGYGCACLSVQTKASSHIVVSISKATARPLAICRHDTSLHEPAHDESIED